VLVFSFTQGVAAAQAGASVVMPNVGRVRDWYRAHPNVPRDPKARARPRRRPAGATAAIAAAGPPPGHQCPLTLPLATL